MSAQRIEEMVIPEINIQRANICLMGSSPLLVNQFSNKAKQEMLDKQTGKSTKQREKKDPQAQYEGSLYHMGENAPAKYGFPSIGFKACACRGAKEMDGLDMTKARTSFHIPGELVPIYGKPEMDTRTVRLAKGMTDIRLRGIFNLWATVLPINYNADVITLAQIVSMFQYGGFGCGVGEWRPEKKGSLGMFHVVNEDEVAPFIKQHGRK